jgi:lysophospholipase L1-like esterase
LGGFEVHILRNGGDELVMTYNPTGLNDGLLTSLANPPVAQGRMPNALIIKGCTLATLKIVTTSNLPVIIDYIGFLNAPQSCTPVMIGKIPYLSAAQYASSQATKVIIDNANAIISNVVKQFAGFPVALFDPNAVYDPNVNSSDGLHPNMAGQIIFADLLQGLILGASKPFVNPNIDQVINGLTVGQGGQTTENTNNYGAALGYGALSANQTGGSNVAIGGLAGGRNTSGSQNVFIGTEAGFANANRSNNIYIGYTAGSNSTGYSNVIIGANAQLPNANDNDSMLIRTGEGSKWIMLHEDGIHFNVSGVPVITAVGASSAVKIPFNYNGTQYYLLATTS